jgi:hypothetical protein
MAEEEIKKLNKSVESIMKHIGAQGSPAQAKKEADQKSKTAQQEADNVKKEEDLLDDKEKGDKESRKLFAGTMRAGSFIWQNLSTHVFSKMNEIFGAVVSHVREVLGPVTAVYDAAKAALNSAFAFIKGTIFSFKDKPTAAEKKTHGFLKTISLFAQKSIDQMKGEFVAGLGGKDKKKPGWMTILLLTIGAIIGGIVAAILKPFVLLGMAVKKVVSLFHKIPKFTQTLIKIGHFFRRISIAIEKLPGVGKIITAFGKIGGFFKTIGKFIFSLITKIPGVKTLLLGFKVGFKFLGWPIAVLFGIIDFVRGFIKEYGTSGSIIESIGVGLKTAIMGFIELPVKIIGWMIDKVLGWFGVEGADSAKKMLGWIGDSFDFVFGIIKWYWTTLIGIFKMVFGGLYDLIKPFADKVWPEIKKWATLMFTVLETIWSFLGGIAKTILERFGIEFGDDKKVPDSPAKRKRLTEAERASQLEKIREEQRAILAKEKADKERADALAKAAKEGSKAVVMAAGGAGGGGGEVPQIPDEVDNWGITSKNYDMEMM